VRGRFGEIARARGRCANQIARSVNFDGYLDAFGRGAGGNDRVLGLPADADDILGARIHDRSLDDFANERKRNADSC